MGAISSGSELDVLNGLLAILEKLAPGRFTCTERKASGHSMIGKPVDLEIRQKTGSGYFEQVVVAVEVANVNTTQLVGETCRLYFDACPLKLLVLGDRNVPSNGRQQCEVLLARLYGQDRIENTPARVVSFADDVGIEAALRQLLLLSEPRARVGDLDLAG